MNQPLKKIVNQSLTQLPKVKIVNSISELGTDAVNKSFQFDSSSQNSLDNQQLLRMQVKQLKRENTFLKGKIQQIKRGKQHHPPQLQKRQSLNCINILKHKNNDIKNTSHQNSVSFILKQIQTILKSLATIHKIQIQQNLWITQSSHQIPTGLQELQMQKNDKQFKSKINKKLQLVSLQKQQTRYGSLLQVFSEFYKYKIENQKKMKDRIQKYIQKTLQISKNLIEKATIRANQKSIKSSCIYSIKPIDQNQAHNLQNMIKDSLVLPDKKKMFGHLQKHQMSYSTIDPQKSMQIN